MNILKKALSFILILALVVSVFPMFALADDDEYRISNRHLNFTFNKKTGGFAIETAEGNPKKVLDDNIPLLYAEDKERSNGTSFITVRLDGDDYIFGKDYGFFGVDSQFGTIRVDEFGNLIEIPWTIKGVTITLTAALDKNANSATTGNVGLAFKVENTQNDDRDVSIRLLLDTALGNRIDAPYFVIDKQVQPTFTETEYPNSVSGLPYQIRCLDSVTNPSRLSYILMKAQGWSGGEKPDKVILGHWANLANVRYDYTPDENCDFSNYSNNYREPDSAAAIYWENNTLKTGESFTGELLYGVGEFTNTADSEMGIDISAERVELSADKKSYANGGRINVTVNIDNTVDNASELSKAVVNLTLDGKKLKRVDGDPEKNEYVQLEKTTKTLNYTLEAQPQDDLTAGTIYVSVSGTRILADGTEQDFETAAQKSIILPATGEVSQIQLNKIDPEIVYTDGEKAITISGKMKPLEAFLASDADVKLKLVHETTGESEEISKNNIAFLDESCDTLTFTTDKTLAVGKYKIVFDINDTRLRENLKCSSITCEKTLQVSADKKYQLKSYGMAALVRTTKDSAAGNYDFFTFRSESEFLKFYKGEISSKGKLNGENIKYNFGKDEEAIKEHEILLTIRANLRESKDPATNEIFWQADYQSGDIIINNMLSYEGDKPLKIYKSGDTYKVEGDGLLKVINSINVWRSKWSISAAKGIAYTLDEERLSDALGENVTIRSLNLSLDGAATMIQSLGGFAVDLKYGVLSSEWYDNSDGMVTYGIGFGGSISLPIKAKDKKEQPDLTADQEDISEELNNLFDESLTADQEDISGDMTTMFDENPPRRTSSGDKIQKDTKLSEGQLSAEVDNVLFGEKGKVEDGYVKVDDTGFIGIDATFSLALPKDVLGSLVANAPGIYASVKINTIKNEYEINAGLNIKIIECEGVLAFKQVNVKNKDVIVPDKIEFYIRDGLKIPVAPPVLFIAGLGGGINELADTIGGEFDKLPPITLLLFTRLEAIGVLAGDFNAKISLEGMSLTGDMKLKAKGLEKLIDVKAGISARWVEPWELNLYGNASIIDGLITGGITVTIADNYFYGYIFASICIPDSIPIVGGKELAGVEAAVSHEFIGANIKIIGIRFGVIYYWGENVSFGKNIDLSPPSRNGIEGAALASIASADDVTAYYGTNIHALPSMTVSSANSGTGFKETTVNVKNAAGQNALLIEIPYTGNGTPTADNITLTNPKGNKIELIPDDGNGNGNMLLQSREDGNFIYITVTNSTLIMDDDWKVTYDGNAGFEIETFKMNGVDEIAELDENGTTITLNASDASSKTQSVTAGWNINGANGSKTGTIDVYLTKDKDILKKIKTSKNTGDVLGTNILHKENVVLNSGSAAESVTLPDSLPDTVGDESYYAVTTLATTEGISLAISKTGFKFKNRNLPKKVDGVKIAYGGNGEIFVSVTDPADADYTHYLAEIVAEDGTVLENNIGQFEKGKNFVFGKEASLEEGKAYHVNIKTLREEYKKSGEEYKTHYYYGTETVASASDPYPYIHPAANIPKLKEVKVNFSTSGEEINTNVKDVVIEYTFEDDVFAELDLNGSKVYAFGVDPNPKDENFSYFKKNWKFVLDDLEDGDYVVNFTAYNRQKDHIKGNEITDVENAYFGFTVDTSAPVLSLAQNSVDRKTSDGDITVVFGANTVFADKDGKYVIKGITEKSAKITLDGTNIDENSEGMTFASNGSFEIEKTLGKDELFKSHLITAADKAGNVSQMTVYAIRKGAFSFDSIELYADGNKISPDSNGVKTINIKNGQKVNLTAAAVSGANSFAIASDLIDWSVLYEKGAVELKDGEVYALMPCETAVKAKLVTASAENENAVRSEGLSDYVIINIGNNSKSDLAEKIDEAKKLIENTPDASQEKKDALSDAIDSATGILNNPSSTEDDFTKGVNSLTQAISAFKRGSGGSGGDGSAKKYNITVVPTEHGKVELSQSRVYSKNSVTITAIPDDGYTVADMLINGKSVGRNEIYTIASVTCDTEVQVIFAEKSDLPFTDVIESDWFYPYVKSAFENEFMLGTSDTRFEPETTLTRAMFVTILHRIDGKKQEGENKFDDVAKGAYYENAVAWAVKNGIVMGVSDTEFAPDENITREQMAAILFRYAKYRGLDTSAGENTNILSYTDFNDISEYAVSAMQYTAGCGLIVGKSETTLNPLDPATRAEAAAVFTRFSDMF